MAIFSWITDWRRRRVINRHPLSQSAWRTALEAVPLLQKLDDADRARLRELTTLFVHDKDFYGAAELELSADMAAIIAAQACLPVLRLGYHWLSGWHSIYVYPGQFRTNRRVRDEIGLESRDRRQLSGEAHHGGGMVLSWQDVVDDLEIADDGANVIIHEIAHKLDMKNGDADGYPPLHRGMAASRWSEVMRGAFEDLNRQLEQGRPPPIDPYAATEPAEFFAVISEYFFEQPELLGEVYPQVLDELSHFYCWPTPARAAM